MIARDPGVAELKFRDPARARALTDTLARVVEEIGRDPVSVMHVCGSHEQAIARFGLRASLPRRLNVIMGPGCPVCITDVPEVDEGVALVRQGVRVATYGDMLKVPGSVMSLADAHAEGGNVDVVYSIAQALRSRPRDRRAVGVLRNRLRDDGSCDGRGDSARTAVQLLRPLGAQVHPAGDGNRRGDARHARRRVPRRRSCGDYYRAGGCSRRSWHVTGSRSSLPASSRSTSSRAWSSSPS